jgi:hypothetical protein
MLCFLMALKSRQVSHDWVRVCRLFEASLQSVYRQTDDNFRIIVVCHETPIVTTNYDARLEFINVDFPPPAQISTKLCMEDKWLKLRHAMIRAGELKPDFVMIMDADDLVSKHLANFTTQHQDRNGWMVRTGYRWKFGSRFIQYDSEFTCGTDSIVSARLIKFPKTASDEERENCIVLRWGHTTIGEKLAEVGTALDDLPFPGAVYVMAHGDNDSHFGITHSWPGWRTWANEIPRLRWLTPRIRDEFGLDWLA